MFIDINIVLIKKDDWFKFKKSVSFSYLLLGIKYKLVKFMRLFVISIIDFAIDFIKYVVLVILILNSSHNLINCVLDINCIQASLVKKDEKFL